MRQNNVKTGGRETWTRSLLPLQSFAHANRFMQRGTHMPHVQITWVEGRSPEQKKNIAARITEVLEQEGRAKRENIHVAFLDVAPTNYAEGGVTVAEQKRNP